MEPYILTSNYNLNLREDGSEASADVACVRPSEPNTRTGELQCPVLLNQHIAVRARVKPGVIKVPAESGTWGSGVRTAEGERGGCTDDHRGG